MGPRLSWRGYCSYFAVVVTLALICIGPVAAQAQAINHAPVISSKAPTTVVAGQAYQYQLAAYDSDNDTITFQLTTQPEGLVLSGSTMSWTPTKAGTYNVVAQASDTAGGYDSQAWQITVSVGDVTEVVVAPNDRPTVVTIGDTQQFSVVATDQYQNAIADPAITWTADPAIGTVTESGVFTPTHGGTGFVAAQVGDIKASVGVVAKDTRTEQVTADANVNATPTNTNTAASTTTPSAATNTNTDTNDNTNQEEVLSENTDAVMSTEPTTEAVACTNPNHKLIVSMLFIYAIILAAYYSYERRHTNNGWWIFPVLLSFIGVIIYYKYFCDGTYRWWPWVLVGIGAALTFYYRARRSLPGASQTELPF
ncbi:MAG: hypothetical protein WC544_01320 [Patescibacteria group bacterium]